VREEARVATRTAVGPVLPEAEAPPVGALLDVVPPDGRPDATGRTGARALTARVLATAPDHLVLATPTDVLGTPVPVLLGADLDLVWSEQGDVVGVAVRVGHVDGGTWGAVATSGPQRVQRRDAVRAPVHLAAVLSRDPAHRGEDDPEDPMPGVGVRPALRTVVEVPVDDLSESGARCVVDPVALRLEHGARVLLELPLDGLRGPLTARVVHRRFRPRGRGVLVGLRFVDVADAEADVVRRYVFARLRELRRRGAV
jgi:hypothetical protein